MSVLKFIRRRRPSRADSVWLVVKAPTGVYEWVMPVSAVLAYDRFVPAPGVEFTTTPPTRERRLYEHKWGDGHRPRRRWSK